MSNTHHAKVTLNDDRDTVITCTCGWTLTEDDLSYAINEYGDHQAIEGSVRGAKQATDTLLALQKALTA